MTNAAIQPGLKGQRQTMVCEHNVAGHVDKFSTPSMIGLMERASVEAISGLLGEGQTSVGYEVNVRHLAPALRDKDGDRIEVAPSGRGGQRPGR